MSDLKPSPEVKAGIDGELMALVFRHGDNDDDVLVLMVEDQHPDLEPFADAAVGGDWREVLIVHDDGPPMPPDGLGLWELRYPWREIDHVLDAEREDVGELCCVYIGAPRWHHVFDPADLAAKWEAQANESVTVQALVAENARLRADNAHLREEKKAIWAQLNENPARVIDHDS